MDDEASGLTAEDKASGDIQENKFNFINQLKDAVSRQLSWHDIIITIRILCV